MKDFMIGESYTREFIVTDELIKNIAKVSGDTNPIHLDETYAEKTIFKKRIAHALFCINGISMIIGNYFPGSGSIILNQNFKYVTITFCFFAAVFLTSPFYYRHKGCKYKYRKE